MNTELAITNACGRVSVGARCIVEDGRRVWPIYLVAVAVMALAYTRLFVDHTPHIPLLFNWTPSLPYHVAWLNRGVTTLARGEFILYRFNGTAKNDYPGLADQPFFKIVAGLPGDKVVVRGRNVFINGEAVGYAKLNTFDGRPLEPIEAVVVPPGMLYVKGTSPDSFDSRYRSSGLVPISTVIGRVQPWF
jgi:conjugal transfer pilin signal peptidase TrbI